MTWSRRVGLSRAVWVWGPAVGLMVAIFLVSHSSSPPEPPGTLSDVGAHGIAYAGLGALMLRGVAGARWSRVTVGTAAVSAVLTILYGMTDEFHQSFVPDRTAEVRDLIADATGAVTAAGSIWAWSIVLAIRHRRHDLREPGR